MMKEQTSHSVNFETRIEIRPDMALVETFQDGSQLIRKNGFMIIVDSCRGSYSNYRLKANKKAFSFN